MTEPSNINFWLTTRELNQNSGIKFRRHNQVTDDLISRLGLERELEGHTGCVNCLEWNERGNLLASGSDDLQIILWSPLAGKKLLSLQSGHQGNIFSVKFLPNSSDCTIVSGAADSKVRVHDLNSKETTMACCCHGMRVKRLAVAPNLPYMFWSAAEDGMILQYDLRQPHHCSSITNNVLINLTNYMGQNAEAKCISINPLRPEMLAVGANDAFVRVYDRRMIIPTTLKTRGNSYHGTRYSWDRNLVVSAELPTEDDESSSASSSNIPPNCAKYFVAGHLPRRLDYRKRYRSYASTYLSFSPDGSELLANLGGEQIYLFDVLRPSKPKTFDSSMYKSSQRKSTSLHTNGYVNGTTNGVTVNSLHKLKCNKKVLTVKSQLPQAVEMLKGKANEKFERSQFNFAIGLYNKAISLCPNAAVLYGNRAAAFIKRGWDGDLYAALRDCHTALTIDPEYFKAHFRLARCLFELRWNKEALECLQSFKAQFPDQAQSHSCELLDKDIQQALFAKAEIDKAKNDDKTNNGSTESSSPRIRSRNSDSLNRTTQASVLNAQEREWRTMSYDYKARFCGHCNTTTDIKEANFFGSDGQYIVAGSDDGSFFTWSRETTNMVRVLRGDESIVNCLQPHPFTCLLATSGIDPVVRLWSPRPQDGLRDSREVENSEDAAAANQRRMNSDPLEVMLMNMGYRIPGGVFEPDNQQEEHLVQCRPS